jgi:hypothetical protein
MALPTALLVLTVLTLLGTAAVFTSATELDIAGNGRRELQALSVAEAGVHEALARLNVRNTLVATRIVPGESPAGSGNPVATWTQTVVNKATTGANEVQTLTGNFGSATALPVSTVIRYKLEDGNEKPVAHCKGPCNSEVVRLHTDFGYVGNNVPTGVSQVGQPVFQIESTYSGGAAKNLLVETTRAISQFKTPGTLRACGTVQCTGSNNMNGTQHPDGRALVAPSQTGCESHVTPAATGIQTQACPANPQDLFFDTWGMTKEAMKSMADLVVPADFREPADGFKGKIVYVTGTAESHWRSSPNIGTPTEPVIVIFEGDLRISGSFTCYCIFYVMGNFVHGSGSAIINGAIVSQGSATVDLSGSTQYTYDPSVVANLSKYSPYAMTLWKGN